MHGVWRIRSWALALPGGVQDLVLEGGADVQDTLAAWMMENAHINIYNDELPEADEDGAAAGDSADSAGAR